VLIDFFRRRTVLGDYRVPQIRRRAEYRGVPHWEIFRVMAPGEPAANQPWPQQAPRRNVSIQRFGTYTRVVLVAREEKPAAVPTQHWA